MSSPTATTTPPHTNPSGRPPNLPAAPAVVVVPVSHGKLPVVTTVITVGPPIPPASLIVLVVVVGVLVVVTLAAPTALDVAVTLVGVAVVVGVGSGVV